MRISGLVEVKERRRSKDGKIVFLVSGTRNGVRIQKERATRAEADALCARLNGEYLQTQEATERPVLTRLTPDRLADAERASAVLPAWATFTEAVQFFNSHYRPVAALAWRDVSARYLHERRSQAKNAQITVDVLEFVLEAFAREAGIASTLDITEQTCREWIFESGLSDRTQRDRWDHLSRLCKWLIAQRAMLMNPIEAIPRPKVKQGAPTILTIDQCQNLLNKAWTDPSGGQMLPFFAICLLSGARPFEVRRAEESAFFLGDDNEQPILEVHKSKTPWRSVELTEPLLSVLRGAKDRGLNLVGFAKRQFDRIRKDAEVYAIWDNDIMRHSFASYHYAKHHDIKVLESNLGTSERTLFKHYIRRTVRKSEADAFFSLSVDWALPRREFAST